MFEFQFVCKIIAFLKLVFVPEFFLSPLKCFIKFYCGERTSRTVSVLFSLMLKNICKYSIRTMFHCVIISILFFVRQWKRQMRVRYLPNLSVIMSVDLITSTYLDPSIRVRLCTIFTIPFIYVVLSPFSFDLYIVQSYTFIARFSKSFHFCPLFTEIHRVPIGHVRVLHNSCCHHCVWYRFYFIPLT